MYGANVIIFEGILTFYNVDVLKVSRRIVREAGRLGSTNAIRYKSKKQITTDLVSSIGQDV